MIKIAVIGAASLNFSHKLLIDLLTMNLNEHCEIVLMGPRSKPLFMYQSYVDRVISANELNFSVRSTTDVTDAVKGANYVITLFAIGGLRCLEQDYKIPFSYKVDQCIGDSMGPGGIFRSQRVLPVLDDLIQNMQKHCPNAVLLNYVNPMAITTMAAARLNWKNYIGLCGGIESTKNYIAFVLEENLSDLNFEFMGINHMCFVTKIEKKGKDLYPLFKAKMQDPGYLSAEKVRFDVMQHYGYFVTESSGHLSDFLPWYRKNAACLDRYCNTSGFHGATGAYYKFSKFVSKNLSEADFLQYSDTKLKPRSTDYGASIIEALHNKWNYSCYGNVSNEGYINNLPNHAAVELPIMIKNGQIVPHDCGELPASICALIKANIIIHELCTEAYFLKDPNLLVNALSLDPLTSSVLTPYSCHRLAADMLEKQKQFFPQFVKKPLQKVHHVKSVYAKKPYQYPEDFDLTTLVKFKRKLRKSTKKDD